MRKVASRLHWQRTVVLVALALALGILAPLLLYSSARAGDPLHFNAYAHVESISDTTTGANGDIHNLFEVPADDPYPWPNLLYDVQVSFQPREWGVAKAEDVPIGAFVGRLESTSSGGMLSNSPCGSTVFTPIWDLMNCTLDKSETATYEEQWQADPDHPGL
ncbi:MAG: hypothetical protein MUP14_08840, partial [Dehalococcoidia bacterium]|nr:hypothetical protein [Dehalococcoidia bacterium]